MKQVIYGIAGILAITTAVPAMAAGDDMMMKKQPTAQYMQGNTATAPTMATGNTAMKNPMQARTTEVVETSSSRTVVVSESKLFGQQIAAELDGVKNATVFRKLVAENGLAISLRDDEDGYTVFVPVDEAMSGMTMTPAAPGKFNPQARAVLESHIVDSKFDVNLLHGTRDNIKSLSGERITVSKAGRSFYANGQLIVGRQHSPEGIIYFVEGPLNSKTTRSAIYNPADAKK